MKATVKIIQFAVAFLFIVSGLVKANDPIGLAYKMQEFFELWSAGFTTTSFMGSVMAFFHKAALPLSIGMITLEIMAGVALLLGWHKKFILWLLLILIIFFTFLTGYAYLSGKFTNCGCFGDCLPITPITSFTKDIILLVLIIFLLLKWDFIEPFFRRATNNIILLVTLFFCLMLQWFVLQYLPVADCLPFKKGNNIALKMKPPPGAVPDSFAIRFIYKKDGKDFEFAPENLPADFTTYTFVDRKQTLVRKGNAEAEIKGFSLTGISKDSITGNLIDSAGIVLSLQKALLIFALDFNDDEKVKALQPLVNSATKKAVPVYIVSPSLAAASLAFEKAGMRQLQFFNTDFTIVRTVARANPTILYMENGVVKEKWSGSAVGRSIRKIESL